MTLIWSSRLYLSKRGVFFLVMLDDLEISRADGLAVGPHLPEGLEVVDPDLLDIRREIIPQGADAEIALLVHQGRGRNGLDLFLDLLPQAKEVLVVPVQLLLRPVEARRPNDKTHPLFHADLAHDFLQTAAVLLVFDLAGDAATALVGHQHQVTPRQGDVGRQEGPLPLAHLPQYLDHHLLAHLQGRSRSFLPRRGPALVVAFGVVFRAHVPQGQETVLLAPVIDEGGLEAPFDLHHDPFVDVARDGVPHGHPDVVLDELAVLHDGHPFLLGVNGVDQHHFVHVLSCSFMKRRLRPPCPP